MDEAFELGRFLPISFNTVSEEKYIAFLWDSFEVNYSNGKYHFSFLSYHMLMMSSIYFNLWKVKNIRGNDFKNALIEFGKDEKDILNASSPFSFSLINERSVFRFLRLFSIDDEKIKRYAKQVDERNKAAHANGVIAFDSQMAIDEEISKIIDIVSEIQESLNLMIREIYFDFLKKNGDRDKWEYTDETDQVREILIHKNYFSESDIAYCSSCEIQDFLKQTDASNIQSLHDNLKNYLE